MRTAATDMRAPPVAGNSAGDLAGAEDECRAIAPALGTSALTGMQCTRAAIDAALQTGPLDIMHLALHGRGDVQRGAPADGRV